VFTTGFRLPIVQRLKSVCSDANQTVTSFLFLSKGRAIKQRRKKKLEIGKNFQVPGWVNFEGHVESPEQGKKESCGQNQSRYRRGPIKYKVRPRVFFFGSLEAGPA